MPIDPLPGEILTKTRDEVIADYKRYYALRRPNADVNDALVDTDARGIATILQPIYSNAKRIGNNVALSTKTGKALDDELELEGIFRLGEAGASGAVTITASAGGTTIFSGDELTNPATGLRYEAVNTKTHSNGAQVLVRAIDTGPSTNVEAGVVLQWTSPRPGCGPNATVVEQADGSGLSGGREEESDEGYLRRAVQIRAEVAATEFQSLALSCPTVPVEQAFVYPAIRGPGTVGIAFTLRPQQSGGNRIPNAAQITEVESWITGQAQADDHIFMLTVVAENADLALKVDWTADAPGWVDASTWPKYYAEGAFVGTPNAVVVDSATSPTSFVLETQNSYYTGVPDPVVGQTIGFYDSAKGVFRRKKILNVSGSGPWTITVDTSNDASDTSYTPVVGQRACPWSESLDDLVPPIATYFDRLGPGEQVASYPDDGLRQRRVPFSPKRYPHSLDNRILSGEKATDPQNNEPGLLDVSAVQNATVTEGGDAAATVGSLAVDVNLLQLRYLAAFPLS